MFRDWHDKHVIITGASSGIGWTLAEMLAARGARVSLIARRAERLEELAAKIERAGGVASFAGADVADRSAVEAATLKVTDALGPCDVLIANAGIHRHTHGRRFDPAIATAVFETNVLGVVNVVGAVLPGMVSRGRGKLVTIASIAGYLGLPGAGAYSGSKSAVMTLMESLRVDLAGTGVECLTICPGFIDTPLLDEHNKSALRMLGVGRACARMIRAMETRRGRYAFPWQTVLLARFARRLPWPLYVRMARHVEKRHGARPSG